MVERNLDDVEFGCKLQYEYIKEKLKKNGFGKMLYNDNDMNKARCKGRVEGAKTELKSIIEEMNECKLRTNCENSTSFWINKFEKRLKELEKKVLKNE